MKFRWWQLGLLIAALPTLIALAALAERESRNKEVRRKIARLDGNA
jgi:hypothetical protein